MSKTDTIIRLAQTIADERAGFFEIKGPGAGDRETRAFMRELRIRAKDALGIDYAEQKICGSSKLAVDFFIPEEGTVVEVALGLRNPNTEFERDILKALMAQEEGYPIARLVFLSKPGAIKRHSQSSSRGIVAWTERTHGINVEIRELRRTAQ